MTFSTLGNKLAGPCGIQDLMVELGRAMHEDPEMRMLGGGNPAAVPAAQTMWREQWQQLERDPARLDSILVNYDGPRGNPAFLKAFAGFLQRECGWPVTAENLIVMPGGQMAFFSLFTLLVGTDPERHILFPIAPEYIGYANQGLHPKAFRSIPGRIEETASGRFKYRIDLQKLEASLTAGTVAMCLSCPTNPTGNVIAAEELEALRTIARARNIPLLLDHAYGHPFPGAIYVESNVQWGPDLVVSISLSKLGLPGTRTSVVVANEAVVQALAGMNSVLSLANGNIGQAILLPLLQEDRLIQLARNSIRPFYAAKCRLAAQAIDAGLSGRVPYALHEAEGAFFLWLWLKGLPISLAELFQRLKKRRVLIVPGGAFFFGLEEPWSHAQECLRISYAQPDEVLREALADLTDEVCRIYAEHG